MKMHAGPQESPQLLTVRQVGERLAIGRTMVHRMIADGTLASVKIGAARRIPASEVERFIEESLTAAGQGAL